MPLTTIISQDRIKLPLSFDAQKMKEEVAALNLSNFIYYNVLPLRASAHFVDPTLEFPPPADDYADGSWTDWLDTPELLESLCLKSVIETFKEHCNVTLVRLLRLEAGATIKEHTDPTLGLHIEKSVVRLTIPILSDVNVDFYLNNSIVSLKPGECWYLRLTDPHRIINNSEKERINMSIDMVPNEWLLSLIKQGA